MAQTLTDQAFKALIERGSDERYRGHHAHARQAFDRAIALAERIKRSDLLAEALLWQGNLLYHCRKYADSERCLKRSWKIARATGNAKILESLQGYHLAGLYRDTGRTRLYAKSLEAVFARVKDRSTVSHAFRCCGMADAHLEMSDFSGARKLANTAKRLAPRHNNPHLSMASWKTIGDCHVAFGEMEKAIGAYSCALEVAKTVRSCGPQAVRAASAKTACHVVLGQVREARRSAGQAMELLRGSRADPVYKKYALLSKCYVSLAAQDYRQCLRTVDEIFNQSTNRPPDLGQLVYQIKGWAAFLLGDCKLTASAAEQAIGEAQRCRPRRHAWPAFHLLHCIYSKTGKKREAVLARQRCLKSLADSVRSLCSSHKRRIRRRPDRLCVVQGRSMPVGLLAF